MVVESSDRSVHVSVATASVWWVVVCPELRCRYFMKVGAVVLFFLHPGTTTTTTPTTITSTTHQP